MMDLQRQRLQSLFRISITHRQEVSRSSQGSASKYSCQQSSVKLTQCGARKITDSYPAALNIRAVAIRIVFAGSWLARIARWVTLFAISSGVCDCPREETVWPRIIRKRAVRAIDDVLERDVFADVVLDADDTVFQRFILTSNVFKPLTHRDPEVDRAQVSR